MKIFFFILLACLARLGHGHIVSDLEKFRVAMPKLIHDLNPKVSLVASPSLVQNNDWVNVTISGVSNPATDDWIGLFSPSDVSFTSTSPVKYQFASFDSNYMKTGKATLAFQMLNMHSDNAFGFFTGGVEKPVLKARSNIVTFSNLNEPLQPHLAITSNPTTYKLMWASSSNGGTQYVKWGTRHGEYPNQKTATSYTYTQSQMCGEPASGYGWKNPGMLYSADLENLQYQMYYYIFGSDAVGWKEGTFRGPKSIGPSTPIKIAAFGDMGKANIDKSLEHWEEVPSLETTDHITNLVELDQIDLVLHIGDISYAVGYSAQWDQFMNQITPIASKVPYMVCIGNHERDFPRSGSYYNGTDSGGECGVPYENRFLMPTEEKDEPWYSFDYGPVHFVLMSTEHDFRIGSKQNDWILQDLKSVDRKKTPWIIFSGHRPMYIDSTNVTPPNGDQPVATLLRENLEGYLMKFRVNLALWGHHHSYQRTCPTYQEKCQKEGNAPVHAVIGMAGMGLSQNIESKQPDWFKVVDDEEYGYTTIQVNATTLHLQFFGNERGLRDEFYLYQ